MTTARKVAHVKSQTQFRPHHCHWPDCDKQVPPAMWGCRRHWFMLPAALRNRIWLTYRAGQEIDLDVSREYMEAADAVQKWIKEYQAKGGSR